MRSALVVTVGTADPTQPARVTGLVEAIKGSIRTAKPDQVILLASIDSRPVAERVQRELDLGGRLTISEVADVDRYELVFRDALAAMRALRATFDASEIELDFTSGTKAMSVGAAMAATVLGSGHWRYTAGERTIGTVTSGTEDFLARSPTRIRAYFDLQAAVRLFKSLQFEAARKLLGEINAGLLDTYGKRVHAGLTSLVDAYDAWDKFDHAGFKDRYRKPDTDLRELAPFAIEDQVRGRLGKMASASSSGPSIGRKTTTTPDHLADLWNNARRRMSEGKLDDAVARLYRLTEMIAQYVLDSTYGIDTSNVDLAALPAKLSGSDRQWLEAMAMGTDDRGNPIKNTVKLGLRDSYRLLAGLGHKIGPLVPPHPKQTGLSDQLSRRNDSILAHGTTPIGADNVRALAKEVRKLAVLAIPDFEARCACLQFPWLDKEG